MANYGERARALLGTSSGSKRSTVLLTCLLNSGRPPRRRNGDVRQLSGSGAARVFGGGGGDSGLGFSEVAAATLG
jgi:hypothetical protein